MRVYQIPKPEGIDSLVPRETPVPRPGRGQVLVRMRAASLNYRDLMVLTGRYVRGAPLPDLVPLSDGAGEVAEIGREVTRVKLGDRVAGIFMQSWFGGDIEPEHARSMACWQSTCCSTSKVWCICRRTCRSRTARRCPVLA